MAPEINPGIRAADTGGRLRGLGPLGVLAVLVILAGALAGPPVAAVLVLAWAHLSRTPLGALGFTRPRSWQLTITAGVISGIIFKLVLKAIVMPLLGAPAINARYHNLTGNASALPGMIVVILVNAGFAEEMFYRGYLFERLGRLLGSGKGALACTIGLTATLFAAAHYPDQGIPGVEQAAMTGLAFGTVFAWRRRIWGVMVAHAAFDLTAVALIYKGWEEPVAHLFFR